MYVCTSKISWDGAAKCGGGQNVIERCQCQKSKNKRDSKQTSSVYIYAYNEHIYSA